MSSGWGNDPGAPGPGSGQPGNQGPIQTGYPAQPDYGAPPPAGSLPPGYGQPPGSGYLAAPPRRRPAWLGPLVIGIIVVLVVGGFFLFRDRLGAEVTSLSVGECFDTPGFDVEVDDVQRQPCNEPHDAEVIASLTHPAPAGEPYPVMSGFLDYVTENCAPAFVSYTGIEWDQGEFDIGWFEPTMNGWRDGNRSFTCYIYRVDDQKMTASLRRGVTNPSP